MWGGFGASRGAPHCHAMRPGHLTGKPQTDRTCMSAVLDVDGTSARFAQPRSAGADGGSRWNEATALPRSRLSRTCPSGRTAAAQPPPCAAPEYGDGPRGTSLTRAVRASTPLPNGRISTRSRADGSVSRSTQQHCPEGLQAQRNPGSTACCACIRVRVRSPSCPPPVLNKQALICTSPHADDQK